MSFLPQLIMNVGGRYDFKYRQGEDAVKSFSPRLALMYVPNERFSLKLSYSEAYADLSFYYRFITKTGYETLKPQHLSAIQLTAMGKVASLDCENIFNTDHYICGPNYQHAPHFQRGRSLMASFSCQF